MSWNFEKKKNIFFVIIVFAVLVSPVNSKAVSEGEILNFNIEENFDSNSRSKIESVLIKTTAKLYFYVERNWWNMQVPDKRAEILSSLDNLSLEFNTNIYPNLTSIFGNEWNPGVDNDPKITILFHSMKDNAGGYFRSADEYIKLQVPKSNEREMLYLPTSKIEDPKAKVFLAHEFLHLITHNQKNKIQGTEDDVWLNEGRSDYVSTILGYDNIYEGSNLQNRVRDFLVNPSDSLTEWKETKYDYSSVNLFINYLVDHYGISILSDSLKSKAIGIESINEALLKNGYKENFNEIFTDWTIAIAINNCSNGLKYCYLNKNLKNLRISPALNFLPIGGNSSLSVSNVTKNWSPNWQKIIGGNGKLKLQFTSLSGLNFQIPYIVFNKDNSYSIKFLTLDKNVNGEIILDGFGEKYSSIILMPSLQTKLSEFNGLELTYPYTFTVSITGEVPEEDQILIQKLLAQIESLKNQIVSLQGSTIVQSPDLSCAKINNNLYSGLKNNNEVKCLQQFLKNQGLDIYPEGLVTGNFGVLTKQSVMRFQKKYGIIQTGFVGILTREKINSLI